MPNQNSPTQQLINIIVVVVAALALFFTGRYTVTPTPFPQPIVVQVPAAPVAQPQASGPVTSRGVTGFEDITGRTITGNSVVATAVAGSSVTASSTLTGSVSVAGTWDRLQARTAISVTNGGIITATGSYQRLTSAGTVTPTVSTASRTAGDLLVLVNTSATTINIADSGTAKLSAAAALGQYDTLTLRFDGTNWVEVARSNN
jgi:hypothetical protein